MLVTQTTTNIKPNPQLTNLFTKTTLFHSIAARQELAAKNHKLKLLTASELYEMLAIETDATNFILLDIQKELETLTVLYSTKEAGDL
jgi:hypothetical protein